MEKRIELEKRGRHPSEIDQLILDDCRSTSIIGLTDAYVRLRNLSIINVGLTSLKGFPSLPSLVFLDISENRISNGLQTLSGCIKLKSLNLSQNKLKDIESIDPLKSLPRLRYLDLSNNEVTKEEGYKEYVSEYFSKTIKCLDGDIYLNGKYDSDSGSDLNGEDGSESEAEEEGEGDDDDDDDDEDDDDEDDGDDDDDDDDDADAEKGNACSDESSDQESDNEGLKLEDLLKDHIDEESEGNDYVLDEEDGVDQESTDDSDDDAGEGDDTTADDSQDTRGKKRKLDE
ncbi:acidic leucine-rich nuclear phosphoprotein 32 family member A-like [Aphis gossypii]|uniref:acidic leucine-rich nuclear phosphoprotein 32 family member A-like n=1 Tax=Aphis gossypii TaxID=80765 RepID=UPI002159207E|nr:acidic leucine-rich nuclear phosphoprotein 32 family member A-like [Aphis gossypii]